MVFLLYKKSKKKRGSLFSKFVQDLVFILLFKGYILNNTYNIIQQTFYFKIKPFTVHYLCAVLVYALLFIPDISGLGLTI